MRLFFHPASSASMRVTLYLRCRGIPASLVELVELVGTDFETDHRGIPVFTIKRCRDRFRVDDLSVRSRLSTSQDHCTVPSNPFSSCGVDGHELSMSVWRPPPALYRRCYPPR